MFEKTRIFKHNKYVCHCLRKQRLPNTTSLYHCLRKQRSSHLSGRPGWQEWWLSAIFDTSLFEKTKHYKPMSLFEKNKDHRIWVEGRDGKSDAFPLLSIPLRLRGLHTKDLRCSAITAGCGCLAIIRESAACVGLPSNLLLLLLSKVGVVSIADVVIGVNNLEYRAFLWFLTISWWSLLPLVNWEEEVVSGLSVARETRLLGWRGCACEGAAGGLAAMDTLLLVIKFVLTLFSFPCNEELHEEGLLSGGGGKELLILLSGGLSKGISDVLFIVFSATSDRLSCFNLVFLSSAIWFSRSRTFKNSTTYIRWVKRQVHTNMSLWTKVVLYLVLKISAHEFSCG